MAKPSKDFKKPKGNKPIYLADALDVISVAGQIF